ncbi:MAG: acetate/propionate family kinase [Acidiphilium sp.]|nr:acetate/propionate family kinase [Acidiphilium sp.]MDD4934497.1 acetate/propionate family kinase [Acidiphilium sp.]
MAKAILTLNAGSSSIKFALFEIGSDPKRIAHGAIERIGEAPHFQGFDCDDKLITERRWDHGTSLSHEDLLGPLLDWAERHQGDDALAGVGHRIVHGGPDFANPVRLDPPIVGALDKLIPFAPLHQPHNLAAIRAITALRPDLPQIGCFDTGFHQNMPEVATHLPLPSRYHDAGVRRYGFHGLSYEYIAKRFAILAPTLAGGRVIAAHIGNGASACAMLDGKSIDTSMGFTAIDGLMMGTRTGALDPGVVLYMAQQERLDPAAISQLLYSESGLLGVSGVSSDMRTLLASDTPHASLAVAMFCRRAAREIAALTVSLGGLDALIFTAGIGEHAPPIRAAIGKALAHFGLAIDGAANDGNGPVISTPVSRVTAWVIPTDEEAMIAHHTMTLLQK